MAKFCFGSEPHYFRSNPLGSRPHLVGQNVLLVCNLFREAELFLRTSSSSTSASQEIPRNLWNPKVHCCVYRILPLVLILSQINPFPLLMLFLEKCGLVCSIKYYSPPFYVEYIYGFVGWGVCMQSRWRHSVTEPHTRWRICVTMATLWQQQDGSYMLFYIFNSTVIDWTSFFFVRELK